MPGRNQSSSGYRFGFNGKEATTEWNSQTGAIYDYGFRIYDARLGRFLSVDPIFRSYPELTVYQFASNRPIDGIDLEGKEYYSVHIKEYPDGTRTQMAVVNYTKTAEGYGPRGDVGITYTIHKVDKDGKLTGETTQFNVKNRHGIYQGGDNPKAYWEKQRSDGSYPDDYSLDPIDETDANAKQHDLDYDKVRASGPTDAVLKTNTKAADDAYIERANETIKKYEAGGIDNVTGKPVSYKANEAAKEGKTFFNLVGPIKQFKGFLKKVDDFLEGSSN